MCVTLGCKKNKNTDTQKTRIQMEEITTILASQPTFEVRRIKDDKCPHVRKNW